jgi:hypothetical protein
MNLINALRKYILFVICGLLVMVFLTNWARSYFSAGNDFASIRKNEKIDWGGPKEGERIELSQFRSERGESFPLLPSKSLILISAVDPRCEMCRFSEDLIEQVRSEAKLNEVKFFVVSFASDIPKERFFSYAKTLSKSDESYVWQGEKETLLPALQKMVIPSHLLINEQGTVLRAFPGSSREKTIRVEMAKEIISDTLAEKAKLK